MCAIVKCKIPECVNKMQSCQLINGMCPSCYSKQQQAIKAAQTPPPQTTGQ